MAICRGCGAESNRTAARYDHHSNFLGEVCKQCDPKHFGEHHDPSDNRIYTGPEAYPEKYKLQTIDGEQVLCATDELIQDTTDNWSNTVWDQAEEAKRRNRRTVPMSAQEIKEAQHWGLNVLRPELERRQLNRQYAHVED